MITGAHSIIYSKDPEADRNFFRDVNHALGYRGFRSDIRDHLTIVAGRAHRDVEWNTSNRLDLKTLRKVVRFDFGASRHANLIEDEFWRLVIETGLPQQIEQTFDVSEAGKVRHLDRQLNHWSLQSIWSLASYDTDEFASTTLK